jgi:DNA-binding GntR family transcriptional regulator
MIGANLDDPVGVQPSFEHADAAGVGPGSSRAAVKGVVGRLRSRIAAHDIPPGARLREWEVANDFGVPRLAAREALEALVHLGFVERQPNRGIVVRQRQLAEILALFDMREVNEGLCARLAARNASPESWDDLIELFGEPMRRIVETKDLDAYVHRYEIFRRRLIDAASSPPLAELLDSLNDMTSVFGRRILLATDRTEHALRDHRAVLSALRQGHGAAAERLRRATIANVRAAVERYQGFVL